LRPNIGIYTQPISFIGLPVVAVPVVLGDGMPIGVQIITAPWREDVALRIAHDLEARGIAHAPRPAGVPSGVNNGDQSSGDRRRGRSRVRAL
jgi:Asp-tRNA(Asn)/Glu-tRNA(Gln) amidotransferase A subunit family amidase